MVRINQMNGANTLENTNRKPERPSVTRSLCMIPICFGVTSPKMRTKIVRTTVEAVSHVSPKRRIVKADTNADAARLAKLLPIVMEVSTTSNRSYKSATCRPALPDSFFIRSI